MFVVHISSTCVINNATNNTRLSLAETLVTLIILQFHFMALYSAEIGIDLLGAWASYRNQRHYLKAYALSAGVMALPVILIFPFTFIQVYIMIKLALVVLSLVQSELVRRDEIEASNLMTTRGGGIV